MATTWRDTERSCDVICKIFVLWYRHYILSCNYTVITCNYFRDNTVCNVLKLTLDMGSDFLARKITRR